MAMLAPWFGMAIGLLIAFWLGRNVAQGQMTMVMAFFGATIGMTVVLTMRKHIWLLIPLCWPLAGNISVLPLPFNVQELAVMTAFAVFLAQVAMKQFQGVRGRVDYVDIFLWLNVAIIFLMYIRNPVGVSALGSENVGGRPYLKVAMGFLAFIILRRIVISPKLGHYFPLIMLGPNFIVAALGFITQVFPFLVPIIAPFYSGITVSTYVDQEFRGQVAEGLSVQTGRFQSLGKAGQPMIEALVAYNNPLRIMSPMSPGRFFLLCLATAFVFMAGFRSAFFEAGMTVLIAAYFWGGGMALFRTALLGIVGVAMLIAVQGVVELPRSVQRSLSFLPGAWNPQVLDGSKESTDWRIEMWKIALTTDRYIENKVLGDGFGFSQRDLAIMRTAGLGGQGFMGADEQKEAFMIQGSYHSGPVSSIRFAGAVGLLAIVAFMVAVAFYAVGVMRNAWDTPFRPLSIVMAVSCVYMPFHFLFIFGEYRDDLPTVFFNCGMLKLLVNSIRSYRAGLERGVEAGPQAGSPLAGANV